MPVAHGNASPTFPAEPGLEPANPAATDGHGVTIRTRQLDDAIVARPLQSGDEADVDDMAAMDADEAAGIQARFDVADGERTEQLGGPVVDIAVVRIGMDRDDV